MDDMVSGTIADTTRTTRGTTRTMRRRRRRSLRGTKRGTPRGTKRGTPRGRRRGMPRGTKRGIPRSTTADRSMGTGDHDRIAADATRMPALRRWRRALAALAKVMADPARTDQVLVFAIHANAGSMQRRIERFFEDDEDARRLFEEQRTIDSSTIDLEALAALPAGTLGHAYAMFLRSRGLTPAVFDGVPAEVSDPRMQYVIQRLRQTHDLWHVVTGHDTDPASEIALQAFTFAQVRAPSAAILAALGTLRGLRDRPTLPREVMKSFRLGRRARRLAAFPWEDHWARPLAEVRRLLDLPAAGAPAA